MYMYSVVWCEHSVSEYDVWCEPSHDSASSKVVSIVIILIAVNLTCHIKVTVIGTFYWNCKVSSHDIHKLVIKQHVFLSSWYLSSVPSMLLSFASSYNLNCTLLAFDTYTLTTLHTHKYLAPPRSAQLCGKFTIYCQAWYHELHDDRIKVNESDREDTGVFARN